MHQVPTIGNMRDSRPGARAVRGWRSCPRSAPAMSEFLARMALPMPGWSAGPLQPGNPLKSRPVHRKSDITCICHTNHPRRLRRPRETSGRLLVPVEATASLWWLAYAQVHEAAGPCWHRRPALRAGSVRRRDSTGVVWSSVDRAGLLAVGVRVLRGDHARR
jgi:hypothetical protein